MSDVVKVLGFKIQYQELNLKLKKEKPYLYEFGLILMNALELSKGYKVKKILKPTKEFTAVVYEEISSVDEKNKEHDILDERLKGLLKEYKFDEIYAGVLQSLEHS